MHDWLRTERDPAVQKLLLDSLTLNDTAAPLLADCAPVDVVSSMVGARMLQALDDVQATALLSRILGDP